VTDVIMTAIDAVGQAAQEVEVAAHATP
jgi:hypothetical protein